MVVVFDCGGGVRIPLLKAGRQAGRQADRQAGKESEWKKGRKEAKSVPVRASELA